VTILVDRSIQIRIRCGGLEVNAFWVSLQANGDVSVGSSDRTMRARRVRHDGTLVADGLVDNPHVTFHHPHWTHLIGNKGVALWQALTWAEPEPGGPPASWIEIVTSPIKNLRQGQGRQGQQVEIWVLDCSNDNESAVLLVDFVGASHAQNTLAHDKYVTWGNTILRFRVATREGQAPSIEVHTWG
jgi:hypothetical protein